MPGRRYLICPDSFKGSLTAQEAAQAMCEGVLEGDNSADIKCLPLADGGEGTAEILGQSLNGKKIEVKSVDALGREVKSIYYIVGDENPYAIIDVASAIGLALIPEHERDIMKSTSKGAGLLVADAYGRGIRKFIIGLGGSATCDGGKGMLSAMRNAGIDIITYGNRNQIDITVLCDVENPFCGKDGAAFVFAPQKGATAAQVSLLDKELVRWVAEMKVLGGLDISDVKGAGAAGGIAGMLASLYGARLVSGINCVLDILDFNSEINKADYILTGEGRIDSQTLHGKTLSGVLERVKNIAGQSGSNPKVVAFCGSVTERKTLSAYFHDLIEIKPDNMLLERAMIKSVAYDNLKSAVYKFVD